MLRPSVQSSRRALVETRRRIGGRPHEVSVFLQLDDPYSYLLSTYLPLLREHFAIELNTYLVSAPEEIHTPQPEMLARYAVTDCRLLARELNIAFLDQGKAPAVENRQTLLRMLTAQHDQPGFEASLLAALASYWRGDSLGPDRQVGAGQDMDCPAACLRANRHRLHQLGHYSSATIHYGGEWYAGVDRLHYLLARLTELGAARGQAAPLLAALTQTMQTVLPDAVPPGAAGLAPLELYHSFRSPFAYLSLRNTMSIADAFGLELQVKPVLPMVMRGLPVPREKLLYIVTDANREAARRGIPFGNFCDPLGAGVERCIALFYVAREQGRAREFILAAGEAIWSQFIDVAGDRGMRKVVERAGMEWSAAKEGLRRTDWHSTVEANRQALTAAGLWGVPVCKVGELALWGQDRDWLLVKELQRRCDRLAAGPPS